MSKSDVAISIRGISKAYRIAHNQERHGTLAETLAARIRRPFRRSKVETFWALKDICFDIKQGEVVGIIGRNGAGKSTLLKIMSRITEPTTGEIDLYGRIGSLLEVGTGFHPELTGRENIFLNGQILGMKRTEIARHFDAIVDFSGIENFIDTPVKRYSSGMYVRLAFAVAAHLQPEILVVDEVLAVGDAEFQKKCLGKMGDVARNGRTVLFVSHHMPAVLRLCKQALFLDKGRAAAFGSVESVVNKYLNSGTETSGERKWIQAEAPGDSVIRLTAIMATGPTGSVCGTMDIQKPFSITVHFRNFVGGTVAVPNLHFYNESGVLLFATATNHGSDAAPLDAGFFQATCEIPGNLLTAGRLFITANISSVVPSHVIHVSERDALVIDIEDTGGARGNTVHGWPGVIRPHLPWRMAAFDFVPGGERYAD